MVLKLSVRFLDFWERTYAAYESFLAPTAALSFSENSVSREELAACLQRTSWSPYLFACARFLTDTDSVILPYRCHSLQILLRYFCISQRTLVSFAFALSLPFLANTVAVFCIFSTNFGFVCLRACHFSRTLGSFRDCCYFIVLAVRL